MYTKSDDGKAQPAPKPSYTPTADQMKASAARKSTKALKDSLAMTRGLPGSPSKHY